MITSILWHVSSRCPPCHQFSISGSFLAEGSYRSNLAFFPLPPNPELAITLKIKVFSSLVSSQERLFTVLLFFRRLLHVSTPTYLS